MTTGEVADVANIHPAAPRASDRLLVATLLPFPLSHPGGVSTYVDGLSTAIQRVAGAKASLIAPTSFQAGPGDRRSQVLLAAKEVFGLSRLGADVVHTHEHPALLAAALLYKAIARHPVRVIHTVHIEPARRWATWKRRLMGALLARCSAVTAVSEHTARRLEFIAEPSPSSIHVIYGAADIKLREAAGIEVAAFRAAYGLGDDGPIICQISPLNFPRKVEGICRLIEAFGTVRKAFPRARLLIVGDGALRGDVEDARSRLGLDDAVVLTGYLNDVSVPLTVADLYCHISLQDACPLSLLEAMRAGKPIVAAATGGIPELVNNGENGLLVDPESSQIAAAVVGLLRDPVRANGLARSAEETASQRFTWDRVAAEFAPLYRDQEGPLMQRLQEQAYDERVDYRHGSPHLSHVDLQDRLLDNLQATLEDLPRRGPACSILEIGAGHGGFTQPMLAWGYPVTATEMSRHSVQRLEALFGGNPSFKPVFDPDGSLAVLGDARFSAIVSVSVLHHIPDYVSVVRSAVTHHLEPGGTLVTFQDPTWYPRQRVLARALDRVAYFIWRLFQGRYVEGLQTRWRRFRHVYDATLTADVVEYHVVRSGVDEQALVKALAPGFERVRVITYWSTNSGLWQRIGQKLGLVNTFGLVATGYRGSFESVQMGIR